MANKSRAKRLGEAESKVDEAKSEIEEPREEIFLGCLGKEMKLIVSTINLFRKMLASILCLLWIFIYFLAFAIDFEVAIKSFAFIAESIASAFRKYGEKGVENAE